MNLITADNVDTLFAPAAAAAQSGAGKKIGFSVYDMQYGFFQDMEKGTGRGCARRPVTIMR